MRYCVFLILLTFSLFSFNQKSTVKIAKLKYNGGGDWYSNKTSLPNLIKFCNNNLGTDIDSREAVVETGDPAIFNYPFIHMTGHGNVVFNQQEAENLRLYLISGGFFTY